jgi:hypothetical protein
MRQVGSSSPAGFHPASGIDRQRGKTCNKQHHMQNELLRGDILRV